jgi:hypothetical protein
MSDTSSSRNQRIIDELLAEAGLENAGDLRPVLLELRALAGERPQPSAAVQALMAPAASGHLPAAVVGRGDAADSGNLDDGDSDDGGVDARGAAPAGAAPAVVDELAARRRTKRRLPLTALSVAVALAAGGAAAAASDEDVRRTLGNVHHAVTILVGTITSGPGGHTAEQPGTGQGGAAPGSPLTTPATSVPAPEGSDPASGRQPGQSGPPVPPAPAPGTAHSPGITLPGQIDPGQVDPGGLGTVPGTGQGPGGKVLPSPGVSPDPADVAPTPPVQLPFPVAPSPAPGR